jgi:hypothetical protein
VALPKITMQSMLTSKYLQTLGMESFSCVVIPCVRKVVGGFDIVPSVMVCSSIVSNCTFDVSRSDPFSFLFDKGPVSKRNFNARHSHGRLAQTSSESFDYVYAPKEQVEANGGRASFSTKRQRLNKPGKSTRFSPATVSKETTRPETSSPEANNSPSLPNSQSLPELSAALRTAGADSMPLDSSQLTVEERQWLQLFRSRPMTGSSGPEAQEWLGAVLSMANQAIGRRVGHERELSALDAFTNLTPEELDSLLDLQDLQMGELTTL